MKSEGKSGLQKYLHTGLINEELLSDCFAENYNNLRNSIYVFKVGCLYFLLLYLSIGSG